MAKSLMGTLPIYAQHLAEQTGVQVIVGGRVIPPFLAAAKSRGYAAMVSFCCGVIPPKAIFGRS